MSKYTDGRPLTKLEQETWDIYEWTLDQHPDTRGYDRVSVHEAFPDIKAAFEQFCMLQTYNRLKDTGNDE